MRFTPLGDHAITITLGDTIDEPTNRVVRAVSAAIDAARPAGVVDQVPAFASVTVHYDPRLVAGDPSESPYRRLARSLEPLVRAASVEDLSAPRRVEIPVCYGGELGPDLEDIARIHGLSEDDVVRIHAEANYLVYMVGFIPGFAYLGVLSDNIATPRRASPRTRVPAGSVGIGGQQTGIYPVDSPGGWNLIGCTPLRIFEPSRNEPSLLAAGDRVRFRPISLDEYRDRASP